MGTYESQDLFFSYIPVCALGECVSFELNWSLSWLKLNLFRSNCISVCLQFIQIGLAEGEKSGGLVNFICLDIHTKIYCQAPAELRALALIICILKHDSDIRVASHN